MLLNELQRQHRELAELKAQRRELTEAVAQTARFQAELGAMRGRLAQMAQAKPVLAER